MEIKLVNCEESVIIDTEDLNRILEKTNGKLYAFFRPDGVIGHVYYHSIACKKRIRTFSLSRLILNYFEKYLIDHIDRNPLNNQKSNLRIVTRSQNNINRKKKSTPSSSQYKGVHFYKSRNKWTVNIEAKGARYFKGYFNTEVEAARKANELMRKHQGEFAVLNTIPEDN